MKPSSLIVSFASPGTYCAFIKSSPLIVSFYIFREPAFNQPWIHPCSAFHKKYRPASDGARCHLEWTLMTSGFL